MIPSKKEIDDFKAKFQEIYDAVVWKHPEMLRLQARVDELLADNTRLVLENRVLRAPVVGICVETSRRDVNGACQDHGGDACLVDPVLRHAEATSVGEAFEVLFKALNWTAGGLGAAAIEIVQQRDRAFEAIREHRSQKADDRCIEDDDRLYAVLGDGIKCDRSVGSKEAMLRNCKRFIENRCEGGSWPTYAELETEVNRLRQFLSDGIKTVEITSKPPFCPVKLKEIQRGLADD